MKIRININKMFCDLHCPGCGNDDFSQPNFIEKGWFRCKKCGTDVKYDNSKGGINLLAVLEEVRNVVHERFKKQDAKVNNDGNL